MPAEAEGARGSKAASNGRQARTPARPVDEVLTDLERERLGLVEAVDQLKAQARATKARLVSPRIIAIAVGAIVALVALRQWRKRR